MLDRQVSRTFLAGSFLSKSELPQLLYEWAVVSKFILSPTEENGFKADSTDLKPLIRFLTFPPEHVIGMNSQYPEMLR